MAGKPGNGDESALELELEKENPDDVDANVIDPYVTGGSDCVRLSSGVRSVLGEGGSAKTLPVVDAIRCGKRALNRSSSIRRRASSADVAVADAACTDPPCMDNGEEDAGRRSGVPQQHSALAFCLMRSIRISI
jgi:hypothetical protein